jgi:response regulator RpfG family c-di-GMP phosphodiesterase
MTELLLAILTAIALGATGILIYYAAWRLPRDARDRLRGSIRAFAYAVECRCNRRYGLASDVSELAACMGSELRLSHSEMVRLEIASYLRHIGLTAIPYRIINLPECERTPAEQATFDRHPEVGASMLELIPSLKSVAPIVQLHAAWWDGTQTPFLPAQFDIPIEARVLAVASAYVELIMVESEELARDVIHAGKGTRFDPVAVDAFSEVVDSCGVHVTRKDESVGTAAG